MSIKNALETIDILIATAPVDHPDAWIPMRLGDLGDIRNALRRAARLETGLLQIIDDLQASIAPAANGTPAQDPPPTSEIPESEDDSDTDDAFDWPAIAREFGHANLAAYFDHLAAGNLGWRKLEPETQRTMVLIVIATLHARFGSVTGPVWDKNKPEGMIKAGGLYGYMPFTEWVDLALETFAGPEAPGHDFR